MTRLYLLLLAVLLLAPGPLHAAGDKPTGQVKIGVHDGHGHDHKEEIKDLSNPTHVQEIANYLHTGKLSSMAPFKPVDLFELKADLFIWTIVVFLLLFIILKKAAWGPILDGLKQREQNIAGALDAAKQAKLDAEKVQAELRRQLDENAQKVAGMIEEARRDAQHTKDEMVSAARAEIQTERERLRREIDTARDQALQDLWHRSADLATLISAKTIQRHLSPDDHRQLVDAALSDLKAAGDQRQKEISIL